MFTQKRIIIIAVVIIAVGGLMLFGPKQTVAPGTSEEVETTTGATTPPVGEPISGVVAPTGQPVATPLPTPSTPQSGKLYKDFVRPTGFSNTALLGLVNTEAFTLKQFVGEKVILLNFWTTSASNALRMFPYLNMWHNKYKDKGLLVISIHVPRFTFEQSKSTVDATLAIHKVIHPVVLDNNYATWNAYGNTVWPHQYLIDINGRIVYDHVGEGAYDTAELKIQELLIARSKKLGLKPETYAPFQAPKDVVVIDLARLKSPETYLGSTRNQTLGNGTPLKEGNQDLEYPATFLPNAPYLSKSWNFTKEYAMNLVADAGLTYSYNAKIVHAVLNAQKLTRVKVLRDGVALTPENAGKDVRFEKGESYFYVSGAHIYEIVNDKSGYGAHKLEFIIEGQGLEVFTITFG
jgi:thiol-disulfide isomerase/thioredoxin